MDGRKLVLVTTRFFFSSSCKSRCSDRNCWNIEPQFHTGAAVLPSDIVNTTALSRVRRSSPIVVGCKSSSSHINNVEEVGNDDEDDDNEYVDDDDCVNNHSIDSKMTVITTTKMLL